MPFLIAYVIFAGREIGFVARSLAVKPIQLIGLGSYSVYLWQQLFLARPDLYTKAPLPIWALPIVVIASVLLIEQPFIRLGRRLSFSLVKRQEVVTAADCTAVPAP